VSDEQSAIQPALTAEQWAEVERWEMGGTNEWSVVDEILPLPDDELPKVMAVANHALPSTDPRKITRADVAEIQYAAKGIEDSTESGFPSPDSLLHIAAKLAALLPPD
jgi:hypothetical protein